MAALGSSLHLSAPIFNSLHQNSSPLSFKAKGHPNGQNFKQIHRQRLRVTAATEGSASKSKEEGEDPSVPSWARPGSDELPPWARQEAQKETSGFEVPFYVYLLASAVTAIAAVGSIFEYANQRPVFGVLSSDSVFYVPVLGFFAFTGIPSSAFLWYKSVQVANKEAEEQDRRDGYL
ncbi:transmembrane protein [Perilla frutescens var. hirtella]|uniref:Transmembrane protein n=1 Tax=Perilla frutescens var. hirtella TaxID=608512 RepID=A0AAD4PFY5_PERFH|nr:transmembrane protein [Perilla frutescens var. hirtella]